jgi:hypothetical protein
MSALQIQKQMLPSGPSFQKKSLQECGVFGPFSRAKQWKGSPVSLVIFQNISGNGILATKKVTWMWIPINLSLKRFGIGKLIWWESSQASYVVRKTSKQYYMRRQSTETSTIQFCSVSDHKTQEYEKKIKESKGHLEDGSKRRYLHSLNKGHVGRRRG